MEVSDVISLDPVNFELPSTCSEETVTITPPCAHTGPAPVHVRLISHALREGQVCAEAWPPGYKTFSMLNTTEHEISTAHKTKNTDK